MANELNLNNGITGLTVTARLYSGATQIGSAISMTEVSGAVGRYTGSMPSTAAGVYGVLFYSAGAQIGSGKIEWDGTSEITTQSSAVIAAAVWNSLTTVSWATDSFGKHAIISNNANRSIGVTGSGSGHVQSDVYQMQPNVVTASALATDAVTEIWAASSRTLTAFAFTPNVGGYEAGQDPATLLLVNGPTNKLKVNPDSTVNATVSGTIVNYVTIPSAVAQASIIPLRITMVRGDTLSVQLPAMGTLTGRTKLIFTAKATTNTPDAAALFQITEAGGLVTLLGSSSVTGTGSLVVANATTGLVNLTLSATATALIPATTTPYVWDCQVIGPSGTRTPISGTLLALPDVTLQAT